MSRSQGNARLCFFLLCRRSSMRKTFFAPASTGDDAGHERHPVIAADDKLPQFWRSADSGHGNPLFPQCPRMMASFLMQKLSYPTEKVLFTKITKNKIVLSFKDTLRISLRQRPTAPPTLSPLLLLFVTYWGNWKGKSRKEIHDFDKIQANRKMTFKTSKQKATHYLHQITLLSIWNDVYRDV